MESTHRTISIHISSATDSKLGVFWGRVWVSWLASEEHFIFKCLFLTIKHDYCVTTLFMMIFGHVKESFVGCLWPENSDTPLCLTADTYFKRQAQPITHWEGTGG